jgi:hypothetical protein
MKVRTEVRLVAAVVYVGLTVFLFDTVASLARPQRAETDASLTKESVIVAVAKAATPRPR